MDKKLKTKWVKALTSGRYEQAREALREGDSFCCLGVLCTVSRKGRWDNDAYVMGTGDDEILCDGDLSNATEKFGITKTQHNTLVRLNDKKLASFKEIAAWIRTNL